MVGEYKLEREKLEIEKRKISIEYKRYILDKKIREADQRRLETINIKDIIANPLLIAIIVAFLSIIANTIAGFIASKGSIEVERTKAENALMLEEKKASRQLQADLLKKFLDAGEDKIYGNLLFLTQAGLVDDYKSSIESYIKNHRDRLPQLGKHPERLANIDPNFFIAEELSVVLDGECNSDCGNNPTRNRTTSLKDPETGKSIDPNTVPYVALPMNTEGLRDLLGKIAVVEDTGSGKRAFAVVGDIAPPSREKIRVDASPAVHSKLGYTVRWNVSVVRKFAIAVLPGPRLATALDATSIETEGALRFEKWGGEAKLRSLLAKR